MKKESTCSDIYAYKIEQQFWIKLCLFYCLEINKKWCETLLDVLQGYALQTVLFSLASRGICCKRSVTPVQLMWIMFKCTCMLIIILEDIKHSTAQLHSMKALQIVFTTQDKLA